eukprot:g4008.t1
MDAIALSPPASHSQLLAIKGFGPSKLEKFGDDILRITAPHAGQPAAKRMRLDMVGGAMSLPPEAPPQTPTAAWFLPHGSTRTFAGVTHQDIDTSDIDGGAPAASSGGSSGSGGGNSGGGGGGSGGGGNGSSAVPRTLTREQALVLQHVSRGGSAFLTGAAGTGKSYLLREAVLALRRRYPSPNAVAITAPTGIAASHLDGMTVHSWAGIGLGRGSPHTLVARVLKSDKAVERWQQARALVLDEVSMLDSELFTALDAIGRAARGGAAASLPFGGLQLLCSGDFCQLPPVGLGTWGKRFAFQCDAWRQAFGCGGAPADSAATAGPGASAGIAGATFVLREVVRQRGDGAFVQLLGEVRQGRCSSATVARLRACHVSLKQRAADGVVATKLYCTNRNVDKENAARLAELRTPARVFAALDHVRDAPSSRTRATLLERADKKAPRELQLKAGAQVVLLRNDARRGLVNGSRGIVVGFAAVDIGNGGAEAYGVPAGRYLVPRVKYAGGGIHPVLPCSVWERAPGERGTVVRVQLPLKLAWALTVHKSQGMTLTRAELMIADAFDFGQVQAA